MSCFPTFNFILEIRKALKLLHHIFIVETYTIIKSRCQHIYALFVAIVLGTIILQSGGFAPPPFHDHPIKDDMLNLGFAGAVGYFRPCGRILFQGQRGASLLPWWSNCDVLKLPRNSGGKETRRTLQDMMPRGSHCTVGHKYPLNQKQIACKISHNVSYNSRVARRKNLGACP